ncbi:DUF2630 family protein [Streptomyces sannanensis]|uniref:DUF2630 family protein n=1 Tax=Streptomyces sannanensis TaxID=285536 RepID=A0ABP6SCR4_9ACTN
MEDKDIFDRIGTLITEERALRDHAGESGLSDGEKARLDDLEIQLDQYWDLLRRRRAKLEFGESPGDARVRPADQVEKYES